MVKTVNVIHICVGYKTWLEALWLW